MQSGYEALSDSLRQLLVTELEFQAQPSTYSKEGTVTTDANMPQHKTNNDTDLQAGDSRFCAVRHIRVLKDSTPQLGQVQTPYFT